MPRGGYDADRNNFAPRLGFAWTLDRAARTVLRGGYGIYYNQGALATSEGLYFNPPYFNLKVFFPDPQLPPLTLDDPFPSTFPVFIPQSATAYQRDLQTPWRGRGRPIIASPSTRPPRGDERRSADGKWQMAKGK